MRFVGIDVASERHVVAAVDAQLATVIGSTPFTEDAAGYQKLFGLLGPATDTLVVMEATGHYWKNLFAHLAVQGFAVALINPLRTHRYAEEDLARTKTDAIDALGLARFGAEKHPAPTPTAKSFQSISLKRLARMRYDGRRQIGEQLARALLDAAKVSVGQHHGNAYRIQVRHTCEDLDLWRRRLRDLDREIEAKLAEHDVGTLLTTIDGIGPHTAARLIAELGDPARLESGRAVAAYLGVIPGLKHSGKRHPLRAGLAPIGHARLRAALWMPTLTAVRKTPWLKRHYERLRARGKLPKVALVACMHKLILAVHSVARNRRPFVPYLEPTEVT